MNENYNPVFRDRDTKPGLAMGARGEKNLLGESQTQIAQKGSIPASFDGVNEALESIEESIGILSNRMGSVLRQVEETDNKEIGPYRSGLGTSPYAIALHEIANRIFAAQERIKFLYQGIEL